MAQIETHYSNYTLNFFSKLQQTIKTNAVVAGKNDFADVFR